MTVIEEIPIYHGGGIDVFWEENAKMEVIKNPKFAKIKGNKEAFHSLARQMLYYYTNNLPDGSHVHYGNFFCGNGLMGCELILEICSESDDLNIEIPDDECMKVALELCEDHKICPIWDVGSNMDVTCFNDGMLISGNVKALYSLAKLLLRFCYVDTDSAHIIRYDHEVCNGGWNGIPLLLQLFE